MSMRTYLLLLVERETNLDYWVEAITQRGPLIMRDDILGICKFAGMSDQNMTEAVTAMTGLQLSEEQLRRTVLRTYLRGYRLEKQQGFTLDDYVMPAEVHEHYPQIELPHFNTQEFFGQLSERVCSTFDAQLTEEGL
jgi:aldehyde:ferredoxin oxidoreductase